MFRFLVKTLPNGRILIRDTEQAESKVIQPREIAGYFEEKLAKEMVEQEEQDNKIEMIKIEAKERLGE